MITTITLLNNYNKIIDRSIKTKIEKINSIMYFEGNPNNLHLYSLITWDKCKLLKFSIFTTKQYINEWKKILSGFNNINLYETDKIENLMFNKNLITDENKNLLSKLKPKYKICGLKPFYKLLFNDFINSEKWAWNDHDLLISSDIPLNFEDKKVLFFRKHCGQLCILNTNNENCFNLINDYITKHKRTYYFDESTFQKVNKSVSKIVNLGYNIKNQHGQIIYVNGQVLLNNKNMLFLSISDIYKNLKKDPDNLDKFIIDF